MPAKIPNSPQEELLSLAMGELKAAIADVSSGRTPKTSKLQEIYQIIADAQKKVEAKEMTEETMQEIVKKALIIIR